jgi:hypothetical protein
MYLLPYILIFLYAVIFGISNYKKINADYIMYTYLLGLTLSISYFMGAVFFSTTATTIISVLIIILVNKFDGIRNGRDYSYLAVTNNENENRKEVEILDVTLIKEKNREKRYKERKVDERKKKKIIFGITSLSIGGAERVLVDIVKELQSVYDITVFTIYGNGEFEKELKGTNVNLKTIFKNQRESYGFLTKKIITIIYRIFSNIIYELHIKNIYDIEVAFLEGPITRLFANDSNANKIAWVHTNMSLYYETTRYSNQKKKIDEKIYNKYNNIIFVSRDSKENFIKMFPNNKIRKRVIYNFIDQKRIERKSRELEPYGIEPNIPSIVVVARLTKAKGLDRLIEVHRRLIKDRIIHNIYIIGEGEERKNLEEKIKEYGIKKSFILLGKRENPYPYILKAKYFGLFSYAEGYRTCIR